MQAVETTFHSQTPERVKQILSQYMGSDQRLRLFYGDAETGKDWLDEYDTRGTINRSCGQMKIPLLIRTSRSMGGGAILDHCIIKIQVGHYVLYKHPKYHLPEMAIFPAPPMVGDTDMYAEGYTHGVFVAENGEWHNHANFKSEDRAKKFVAFLRGERLIPY